MDHPTPLGRPDLVVLKKKKKKKKKKLVISDFVVPTNQRENEKNQKGR